jgi:hypothetical protein
VCCFLYRLRSKVVTMKLLLRLSLIFIVAPLGTAFVVDPSRRRSSRSVTSSATCRLAVVALEPEPAGGIELTSASTSMAGCRIKQLDDEVTVSSSSNVGNAFKFWMTASAEGKLIESIRSTILKDASKKANFPGFRKVCVSVSRCLARCCVRVVSNFNVPCFWTLSLEL